MRFLFSLLWLVFSAMDTTKAFMVDPLLPAAPFSPVGSSFGSSSSSVMKLSSRSSNDDNNNNNNKNENAPMQAMMKQSADMMKNLKPQDIDDMIREMDNMPAAQRAELEKMGMDPAVMKQSLQMMKTNPAMAQSMADMMQSMTPEEMIEQSKQAQERLKTSSRSQGMGGADVKNPEMVQEEEEDDADEDDEEEEEDPLPDPDPQLLDAMFRAAELMADPPTGGVTVSAFASLGPIALLMGDNPDKDLSKAELKECWADGSLGSTRVDRAGFERVWLEVQEFFSVEIIDRARERSLERWKGGSNSKNQKQRRGNPNKPKPTAPPTPTTTSTTSKAPQVGSSISSEQLDQQVKNMSDQDLETMLEEMSQTLSPEQEARMKAMGVDPTMMQKTASMMKGNPLLKNAAKMMMKNMSPEQMKQASQQAQAKMSNMTPEERQKMLQELEQEVNKQK